MSSWKLHRISYTKAAKGWVNNCNIQKKKKKGTNQSSIMLAKTKKLPNQENNKCEWVTKKKNFCKFRSGKEKDGTELSPRKRRLIFAWNK